MTHQRKYRDDLNLVLDTYQNGGAVAVLPKRQSVQQRQPDRARGPEPQNICHLPVRYVSPVSLSQYRQRHAIEACLPKDRDAPFFLVSMILGVMASLIAVGIGWKVGLEFFALLGVYCVVGSAVTLGTTVALTLRAARK